MNKKLLRRDRIGLLIEGVIKDGVFIAPSISERQVVYGPVKEASEITFDYIIPRNSFKDFLFPQTEPVARFKAEKDAVLLEEVKPRPEETVIFGVRPCDAASRASLRSVFTWDFKDEFYTKREERALVITIACTKGDDACFCATAGISPEGSAGSDILLRETEAGDFIVEKVTGKGGSFIDAHPHVFEDSVSGCALKEIFNPEPIGGVNLEKIKEWLKEKNHYENPLWAELSRKCIGCGACTFVCPTCHCFDIIDEGTYAGGERRKNWDACQFEYFTLHASGHNPRDTQYKRWRNRFMCKFNFYPEKFKSIGCVGCGRCVRVCPVRLDITEVMAEISGQGGQGGS